MTNLEIYFEKTVDIPKIKVGKKQTLETLMNKEALLFAKYLRTEINHWKPRLNLNRIYKSGK